MTNILRVFEKHGKPARGVVCFGDMRFACALGENGIVPDSKKREGDKRTPAGLYAPMSVYTRKDRVEGLKTLLPLTEISKNAGWCDDPASQAYNQFVTLPHDGRAEGLWRDDGLYDAVLVISHNQEPVIPGKGSAIFFHIAKDDFSPTKGCVAMKKEDMITVLEKIGPETLIRIHPDPAAS